MSIKTYFTGKTGLKLWGNVLLMVALVVAIPVVAFFMLNSYTLHGETIEVPSVVGKLPIDAERTLDERGLLCVVSDSAYDKTAAPGVVLEQSPVAGSEVKAGRMVYLKVNLRGEPMVRVPKIDGSLREVEAALTVAGFRMTEHEVVMDRDKDLVIGVRQGGKMLSAGQMASRDRAVTIIVGGGETVDTLAIDDDYYGEASQDTLSNDFDIDL